MHRLDEQSGWLWVSFIPGIIEGALYKFEVKGCDGVIRHKSDPYALFNQFPTSDEPASNASIVWRLDYSWKDDDWMKKRKDIQALDKPISIYELHLGSWKRGEANRWLTYRELAPKLAKYLLDMGHTHVEFVGALEHLLYISWGYQVSNYYAPTSRYGSPQDFMYLIDYLHQHNIGVILDWVPAHFPKDEVGLYNFDAHICIHIATLGKENIATGAQLFLIVHATR